jgi:hypothetical protein
MLPGPLFVVPLEFRALAAVAVLAEPLGGVAAAEEKLRT